MIGGEATSVSGQIDRLAVLDGEVLLADFKTDARVRRSPAGPHPRPTWRSSRSTGSSFSEIYPGRRVRPFLVWTAGPSIQELRTEDLDPALDRLTAA